MARKKKSTTSVSEPNGDAEQAPMRPAQKIPEKLASPFAAALKGVKPAPARAKVAAVPAKGARSFSEALEVRERGAAPEVKAAERSLADRNALRNALAGVKPLGERDKRRVPVPPLGDARAVLRGERPDMSHSDAEARQRLAGLVAGNLRFDVSEDEDGRTEATRIESGGRVAVDASSLARLSRANVDDELDLHHKRGDEAEELVAKWIRARHRQGARTVRIVHGKGLHSEGGVPVLRERVVHALTEGGAAPLVLGFVSAAPHAGGTGALVVKLAERV